MPGLNGAAAATHSADGIMPRLVAVTAEEAIRAERIAAHLRSVARSREMPAAPLGPGSAARLVMVMSLPIEDLAWMLTWLDHISASNCE